MSIRNRLVTDAVWQSSVLCQGATPSAPQIVGGSTVNGSISAGAKHPTVAMLSNRKLTLVTI